MFKLTGQCKEDFESWLLKVRNEKIQDGSIEYDLYYIFMYMMPDNCKNPLIIEFFEQFQYCGENLFHHHFNYYWNIMLKTMYVNDVFNQTIEMCELIYNKNKSMLTNPSKN